MIDWLNLAANSLWIVGLALALAVVSYASWEAAQSAEKLRARLAHPARQAALDFAGALFCLGLAATSASWWEKLLWGALAGLFGLFFAGQLRKIQ